MTEGVTHRHQIRFLDILPTVLELLRLTTAAFREAGITEFVVIDQHLSAGSLDSLGHSRRRGTGDTLIALTVVVGTDIKQGMVLTVVPAKQLVLLLHKREEIIILALATLGTFLDLIEQPRTGDDGMRLQQFGRRGGTHLTGNHTLQVLFHRQFVDSQHLISLDHQTERATERLFLLSFPVEPYTDGDIMERERHLVALRLEAQLTIVLATPEQSALSQFHGLETRDGLTLCGIVAIQAEHNLLSADDSHGDLWLLTHLRQTLHIDHILLQALLQGLHLLLREGALLQDSLSHIGRDTVEVLTARRDEVARHIQGTGTHQQLFVASLVIAVGTVLPPGEHHRDKLIIHMPCHDIHHGLRLFGQLRQGVIERGKHTFTAAAATCTDHQCGTGIILDHTERGIITAAGHLREVARQALPLFLQGKDTRGTCLQMGMVGCRGTTERSVIEDHQFGIMSQQLYHLAIHATNLLGLMPAGRNGEMHGEDGIWVDQQFIVHILYFRQLLCGTVLPAQETRTGCNGLLGDGGTCRTDTCGVELHLKRRGTHVQLACLHMTQFPIAVARLRPQRQLTVEIAIQR